MTGSIDGPPEPVRIRDRHGARHERPLAAHQHRALFARLLLAPQDETWRHVWPARRRTDGRLIAYRRQPNAWFDGDLHTILARAAAWEARDLEVFAAMLPRSVAEPSATAVMAADRVWVDVDGDAGRLDAFGIAHPPQYMAASGGPGNGRHAVWLLDRCHEPSELVAANRRLAAAVGGDPAVCFAGANLRLPGTRNHKPGGGWCRILTIDGTATRHRLDQLVAGLPELARPAAGRSGAGDRTRVEGPRRLDPVAAIPPPIYVAALCRLAVPEGGGMVRCPLPGHPDTHPSCRVGASPRDGWRCFSHPGGPVGGRIYDLASALVGGPTGDGLRGPAFLRARQLVMDRIAAPR